MIKIEWLKMAKDIQKYFYTHMVYGLLFINVVHPSGHPKQYSHKKQAIFRWFLVKQGIVNFNHD